MIYDSKTIAKTIALETLAAQGIDDLNIEVTSIEDSCFGDEVIVRYSVDLPRYGKSNGCLFIPAVVYLSRAWELAHRAAPIAA